jgi:hypothetical protein
LRIAWAVALAGCAKAGPAAPGGTAPDLERAGNGDAARARDLESSSVTDGGARDLASSEDLASFALDLRMSAVDLATAASDLARAPSDLAVPDLAPPPVDQAMASAPADLARTPQGDLAGSCVPTRTPCDEVCQNCPAGQACVIDTFTGTTTVCVTAGTVPTGGSCTTAACVAGDVCLIQSTVLNINLCFPPFCHTDSDCSNGGRCVFTLGGGFMTCSEGITNCDPVALTGCATGGCFLVTPDGATGCHMAGPGGQGASCDSDYACQAGHACLSLNGMPTTCFRLCNQNGDCAAGTSCSGGITGTTRKFCL